jgi:hypothetical protein
MGQRERGERDEGSQDGSATQRQPIPLVSGPADLLDKRQVGAILGGGPADAPANQLRAQVLEEIND